MLTFVYLAKFLGEWLLGFGYCLLSAELENGRDEKDQGVFFWVLVFCQALSLCAARWSGLIAQDIQVGKGCSGALLISCGMNVRTGKAIYGFENLPANCE